MMTGVLAISSSAKEYLQNVDKNFAKLIETFGDITRECDDELFCAITHQIIAQQISNSAQHTIFTRLCNAIKTIDPSTILATSIQKLQSFGISKRKATYILENAKRFATGDFNKTSLEHMTDEEAVKSLCTLKGVGEWTANMVLLFSLKRPNIFSFDDAAIKRGLCLVYGHETIDRPTFEMYRKRFSPYCSAASLYLWQVASKKQTQ